MKAIVSLFFQLIITKLVSNEVVGPADTYISSLGINVTLTCTVNGTFFTISWIKLFADNPSTTFCTIKPDGTTFGCDLAMDGDLDNFDLVVVPGDPSDQYNIKITGVEEEDLGEYACTDNVIPDSSAILALAELPSSLEISDSSGGVVEVFDGVAQTLTCTAYNSKPQVSIQWTIDGSNVTADSTNFTKDNGNFTTASYMTYTYTHAVHHGKKVECVATNLAGTSFTNVTLNVLVAPASLEISDMNGEYANGSISTLINGTEHSFSCVARGANPATTITWHLNGAEVTDQGSSTTSPNSGLDTLYDTNSTLTFTPNYRENLLTCRATNSVNEPNGVESGIILEVHVLPGDSDVFIVDHSAGEEVTVLYNTVLNLTCQVNGVNPAASITWYNNDEDITNQSQPNTFQSLDGLYNTESVLTFTPQKSDHNHTIKCEAIHVTLDSSQYPYTSIQLNVEFPATITNPDNDNEFADEGGEAVLRCEAEGNPLPDFTWTKDNTTFINGGENHTELHVSEPDGVNRYSTLTIWSVDPGRDFGDYTCNASNPHGYDILTINLNGTSVPEPATGISVTDATDTTLTVTWVEGQDGGYTQTFTVEYRVYESGEDTWMDSEKVDHPPMTLGGLQPLTQYEIRVRSNNTLGSMRSQPITANTTAVPTTLTTPITTPTAGFTAGVTVTSDPTALNINIIIGTVVGLLLFFGISVLLALLLLRKYNVTGNDILQCKICKNSSNGVTEPHYAIPEYKKYEAVYTNLKMVKIVEEESSTSPIYSDVESRNWEFARDRIELKERVGSGAFGQVWQAEARNITGNRGRTIVAVKTLKDQTTEEARKDLLSELEFMKLLSAHPNVVSLLGCCTQRDPIYVIVEFVPCGNLQKFLRDHRSQSSSVYDNIHKGSKDLTPQDLISFAHDTAKGMAYLSSMKCIHRDLAARNVLVGKNKICKVADFGFARDVLDTGEYEKKTKGRLPIRWMALESLVDSVYTLKSDVWSFGVLLWEIVTMGSSPYPGMTGGAVIENLQDGYRMPKPKHCSQQIYDLMLECWNRDQEQRIPFSLLAKQLENMLRSEHESHYVNIVALDEKIYYPLEKYSISGEII